MPAGARASRTQRERWEAGRRHMARTHAGRLLSRAARRRDRLCFDLAVDLLVPPLATIALSTMLGLVASAIVSWWAGDLAGVLWVWLGCALALGVYGLRAWQLSGTGARGLYALCSIPRYLAWKVALSFRRSRGAGRDWVRTARERTEAP
jgi:hypothetical protein